MRPSFPASLLGALCLSAFAAAAHADTLIKCELDNSKASSAGNWIDPKVQILHDEAAGTATVYDGLIHHFEGKPIAAKISTDNKKRTTFTWTLEVKAGGDHATMQYRLTVMKADDSAHMVALPLQYGNTFQMSGHCNRSKA